MEFREIIFGSAQYDKEVELRCQILRNPLGLELKDENLEEGEFYDVTESKPYYLTDNFTIYVDKSEKIISVICEANCIYNDRNIIGMTIDEFIKFTNEKTKLSEYIYFDDVNSWKTKTEPDLYFSSSSDSW